MFFFFPRHLEQILCVIIAYHCYGLLIQNGAFVFSLDTLVLGAFYLRPSVVNL